MTIRSHFRTNQCRNPWRPPVPTAHPCFWGSFFYTACSRTGLVCRHGSAFVQPRFSSSRECIFSATPSNPRDTEVDWAHKQIHFLIMSLSLCGSVDRTLKQRADREEQTFDGYPSIYSPDWKNWHRNPPPPPPPFFMGRERLLLSFRRKITRQMVQ